MGKGDKKTRRGKLFSGSYGVQRPRKRRLNFSVVSTTKKTLAEQGKPKAPKPKPAAEPVVEEKTEVVAEEPKKAAAKKPTAKKPSEKEKAPKEEKPATEAVAEKKPAAKKPVAKKPAAKKEPKPQEEAPKEDAPKDKK